jgi:hypothetical protein
MMMVIWWRRFWIVYKKQYCFVLWSMCQTGARTCWNSNDSFWLLQVSGYETGRASITSQTGSQERGMFSFHSASR